jgi:multiple sugar transport system substrate-binding protein
LLKWLSLAAVPLLQACGSTTAPTVESTQPASAAPTSAPAATQPAQVAAPTAAPAATQPTSATGVTLMAAHWSSSPEDHNVFVNVFKAFEEHNPGIKVDFNDVPSDTFTEKLTTMIVGGTPPDTMELHPAWVLNFIHAKQMNDLTDLAKTDKTAYVENQLNFWIDAGKLYGMPYYSGPSFIFYNKTLFKKQGAKTPEEHEAAGTWTWTTLRDLAKQVTSGTGAAKTFGWDAAQNLADLQFYACVPVWDNNGDFVNQDNTAWLVDSDPVVEVIQWHADMYLKDKSIPMPSDLQGISWLFRTGRLGMAWAGKFRSIELVNAEFEVGMIGTPKEKTGPINRDGPNASGLPVGTKHIPEAYKLALFIGGPDAAPIYLASGRSVPVQTALLDSDYFKKALKPYERAEVYAQSVKTVRAWRVPGKAAEATRAFGTEWDKVLVGQQDVKTAMKNAKPAMDATLK